MYVKLVKGKEEWQHHCTHIHVTEIPDDCAAVKSGLDLPGIVIEVCMPQKSVMWRLPDNGDVVYVMNEDGDTIGTYRWPLSKKQKDAIMRDAGRVALS